jgi:pilus assembly protein Flp/PilA
MFKLGIWSDTRGQDMLEYALIAALVTVAAIAVVPGISTSLSTIFSKIASTMTASASTS